MNGQPQRQSQHQLKQRYGRKRCYCNTLIFVGLLEWTFSELSYINSFDIVQTTTTPGKYLPEHSSTRRIQQSRQYMFPPPGSGYASSSDDYKEIYKTEMPATYEPMMAFPGTMRPGKTPENMPFQDLPIGDDDPDPVPWPHFQQIEWHHRWSQPPHEHPGTMEDFIDTLGRWATPQQEAAMRAGVRRDLRQRQEVADNERRDTIITDDDDEDEDEFDDDFEDKDEPVALGDGIFGKLGSDADRAATAAAVSPDATRATTDPVSSRTLTEDDSTDIDDLFADDDLDDFLLDLGLDAELDDDVTVPGNVGDDDDVLPTVGAGGVMDDDDDDMDLDIVGAADGKISTDAVASGIGLGVTPAFSMDNDDDFVDIDDDDDDDSVSTVPLEDFGDDDNLDVEDIFDEGGFDYDDGDYGGGNDGDVW
jgi:hypothetical protein